MPSKASHLRRSAARRQWRMWSRDLLCEALEDRRLLVDQCLDVSQRQCEQRRQQHRNAAYAHVDCIQPIRQAVRNTGRWPGLCAAAVCSGREHYGAGGTRSTQRYLRGDCARQRVRHRRQSGNQLWKTGFCQRGGDIIPVPSADTNSGDITPEIGIISDAGDRPGLQRHVRRGQDQRDEQRHALCAETAIKSTSATAATRASRSPTRASRTQLYLSPKRRSLHDQRPHAGQRRRRDRGRHNRQSGQVTEYRVYFNAWRQLVRPALVINGNNCTSLRRRMRQRPVSWLVLSYDISGATPVPEWRH